MIVNPLGVAPERYSKSDQDNLRRLIEQTFNSVLLKGVVQLSSTGLTFSSDFTLTTAGTQTNVALAATIPSAHTWSAAQTFSAQVNISPGPLILGTDPGSSDILRVGGSVRIGAVAQTATSGQLHIGQAGRIDQTWYDSTGAADAKIWTLSVDGAGGANTLGVLGRMDAGGIAFWVWRAIRNAGALTTLLLAESSGVVTVGADPGSSEILRVGGNIAIAQAGYLTTGAGTGTSYLQLEGTPRFNFSLSNTVRARLGTGDFSPAAAGGLALGTASLPWSAIIAGNNAQGGYLGVVDSSGNTVGFKIRNPSSNIILLDQINSADLQVSVNGVQRWAFHSGGPFEVVSGGLEVTAGNVGIGIAPVGYNAIYIAAGLTLTGSTVQSGIAVQPTFDSGATSFGIGVLAKASTAAAAFTMGNAVALYAANAVLGTGSTITTQYGLYVESQTRGGTNYAIYTNTGAVSFGDATTIRSGGLAVLAGNVGVGTGPTSAVALYFNASITAASGTARSILDRNTLIAAASSDFLMGWNNNGWTLTGGTFTSLSAAAIRVESPTVTGTIANLYGLKIENITGGTANWAIVTGTGLVRHADQVQVTGGANPSVIAQAASISLGGGGTSPNGASLAWGDNTGWILRFGTIVSSTFTARFNITDSGLVEVITGDLKVTTGNLNLAATATGVFDNSMTRFGGGAAPAQNFDVWSYDGAATKWRPRFLQTQVSTGVLTAAANGDGTFSVFAFDGRTLSGTSIAGPTPTVTAVYGGFIIDMGTTPPAGFAWDIEWTNSANANIGGPFRCTSQKAVFQFFSANSTVPFGTTATTFQFKVSQTGGTAAVYGTASTALAPSLQTEVNAFGLIVASQIACVNLAAISADLGVVAAGVIADTVTAASQKFNIFIKSTAFQTTPGANITGGMFFTGANPIQSSVTGLGIDFSATGTNPILRFQGGGSTPLLQLLASGAMDVGPGATGSPASNLARIYTKEVSDAPVTGGTPSNRSVLYWKNDTGQEFVWGARIIARNVYTANATWTKSASTVLVMVHVWGSGGGGGSGRADTSSTNTAGGGTGGGGGCYQFAIIRAQDLPATVAVTVGAGGTGGAAVSITNNGNAGTDGHESLFGNFVRAGGGAKGLGGLQSTAQAGGGGGGSASNGSGSGGGQPANTSDAGAAGVSGAAGGQSVYGGAGGGGVDNGTIAFAGGLGLKGGGGGGAGGAATNGATTAGAAGGSSGKTSAQDVTQTSGGGGAGGAGGTPGTAGTAGSTSAFEYLSGTGGGGGGGGQGAGSHGGAGGAGGQGGGGGGGGGGFNTSVTTGTSGAGGNGGSGQVIVYELG